MTVGPHDNSKVLVTPEQLIGYCIDDRYRLEGIVGGGGMGVVYRTHQQNLNRDVAIKLLKLEDGNDRHRLERFRREIDIVAQLSHPNIVRVFDSGRDAKLGLSYIVMELVDGMPLDEVMSGHQLSPTLALDIAHEVCAALTEPHAMGIIHRDIKPANILVYPRSDDTVGVKVVDFGIARSGTHGGSRITTTGVVVGSPMYMAPEVARGEELDARTDLYSLGVVLYEMISGVTPFRGSTPVAIMLRQAVDDPPSLAESVPGDFQIPELVELVDAMLAKDRRSRPADARAVLRKIAELRKKHGLARPAIDGSKSLIPSLGEHRRAVEAEPEPEQEADPYSPTRPWKGDDAPSAGDSFHGWLIPETARQHLTVDGRMDPASTDDTAAEVTPRRSWLVGAVAALVAIALAGAGFLVLSQPTEIETPAQLGDTIRLSEPVAPVIVAEPPDEAPPAPVEPAVASPDGGAELVQDTEDVVAPAQAPVAAPRRPSSAKPQQQPSQPAAKAEADKIPDAGGAVENLEWIRQK